MEKRIYEIGKRLLSKHEIHWYGIGWWLDNNSSEMYKDGMYFHSVCKPMPLYASNGSRSTKEAIWFAIKLFLPLQRQRFDVIVCEQFPYLSCFTSRVVSSLRRSNLVIDWHEIWGEYWFEYQGSKGMIGLAIEKLVSKLTSNNIAVSKATRARLELLTGSQVKLFPNGVDLDLIERVNPSNEQFDFIFAGRLIEEKGVDLLLRAMKRVLACNPNLNCLVLGEGPEKKSLQTLATSLGIESSITFVGRLEDYDRVVSYMKSSKVFVLPYQFPALNVIGHDAYPIDSPMWYIEQKQVNSVVASDLFVLGPRVIDAGQLKVVDSEPYSSEPSPAVFAYNYPYLAELFRISDGALPIDYSPLSNTSIVYAESPYYANNISTSETAVGQGIEFVDNYHFSLYLDVSKSIIVNENGSVDIGLNYRFTQATPKQIEVRLISEANSSNSVVVENSTQSESLVKLTETFQQDFVERNYVSDLKVITQNSNVSVRYNPRDEYNFSEVDWYLKPNTNSSNISFSLGINVEGITASLPKLVTEQSIISTYNIAWVVLYIVVAPETVIQRFALDKNFIAYKNDSSVIVFRTV